MIRRNRRESSGRICIIPRNLSLIPGAFSRTSQPPRRDETRFLLHHPLATRVMRAFFLLVRSTSPGAPSFDASPPRLYIVTRRRICSRGHPRSRSGRVVHSAPRAPALIRAHSSLRLRRRAFPLARRSSILRPERVPPPPGSLHLWRFAARVSPTHAFAASSAARAPAIFSSIFAMRSSESSNASMCLT